MTLVLILERRRWYQSVISNYRISGGSQEQPLVNSEMELLQCRVTGVLMYFPEGLILRQAISLDR